MISLSFFFFLKWCTLQCNARYLITCSYFLLKLLNLWTDAAGCSYLRSVTDWRKAGKWTLSETIKAQDKLINNIDRPKRTPSPLTCNWLSILFSNTSCERGSVEMAAVQADLLKTEHNRSHEHTIENSQFMTNKLCFLCLHCTLKRKNWI